MDHTIPYETLVEENRQLTIQTRKLRRELMAANQMLDNYKKSIQGKDNLSKIITAEKQRRERYMASLLRVMPEIVLFLGEDLRIVMCSDAYLAAVGVPDMESVIGKPAIDDRGTQPAPAVVEFARHRITPENAEKLRITRN